MNQEIIKSFKCFESGSYAYETIREINSEEDLNQLAEELKYLSVKKL